MYVLVYTYTLLTMQIDHCGPFSWGQSAGAISVGLQMVTNSGDNEGLFRGAIMESGSPLPTGDTKLQQPSYDTVVQHAGCAGAEDTLECLRGVSADTLMAAAEAVPNLFDYPVGSGMSICEI